MGFDVMGRARLGWSRRESLSDRSELGDGTLDQMDEVVSTEQDSQQQAGDDAGSVGPVALAGTSNYWPSDLNLP